MPPILVSELIEVKRDVVIGKVWTFTIHATPGESMSACLLLTEGMLQMEAWNSDGTWSLKCDAPSVDKDLAEAAFKKVKEYELARSSASWPRRS